MNCYQLKNQLKNVFHKIKLIKMNHHLQQNLELCQIKSIKKTSKVITKSL
jgi:hypothetical protein